MTFDEKEEALLLLGDIEKRLSGPQSFTKEKASSINLDVIALKHFIEKASETPEYLEKTGNNQVLKPQNTFTLKEAMDSHTGYKKSRKRLRSRNTPRTSQKDLKGFFVDIEKMPLLFDEKTKECKASRLFLMFGKKPDVNLDGTLKKPVKFENPYFTIMVMGLKSDNTLISNENSKEPAIYEYLTPYNMPCDDCTEAIEEVFPSNI